MIAVQLPQMTNWVERWWPVEVSGLTGDRCRPGLAVAGPNSPSSWHSNEDLAGSVLDHIFGDNRTERSCSFYSNRE